VSLPPSPDGDEDQRWSRDVDKEEDSAQVAVSIRLYIDEIEAEYYVGVVDLCVAEVNPTVATLPKLNMWVERSDEEAVGVLGGLTKK
jgi:hypothetical protein